MKKMFPFIRELWAKRKSTFTEDGDASLEVVPTDRLRQYAVNQSHDQASLVQNRPQTLQEGFFESIQIMRSISTHLEEQAKNQKQMIEAIPLAMNSVNRNLQVSEASQKRMHEALDGLAHTLSLINRTHQTQTDELQSHVKKQNFLLVLAASLLITLCVTAILIPIFFSFKISHLIKSDHAPALQNTATLTVPTMTDPSMAIPLMPTLQMTVTEKLPTLKASPVPKPSTPERTNKETPPVQSIESTPTQTDATDVPQSNETPALPEDSIRFEYTKTRESHTTTDPVNPRNDQKPLI